MFDAVNTRSKEITGSPSAHGCRGKVLILFGTRPEAIKMAPVIHELRRRSFRTIVVSSSQHKHLLAPFLKTLKVDVDIDLQVMKRDQTPNDVCSRIIAKLDRILDRERPDMILVQGDTTTTLAGALAAFYRKIPVGHIEAGLRSGDLMSPFPEEMNRRAVSQMTSIHFASTEDNKQNLLSEGVETTRIAVTGNPVVDAMKSVLKSVTPSASVAQLIAGTRGKKRVLLTTHRRESFGETMSSNLHTLRDFVEKHDDVCLIFPVHPNPNVRGIAREILGGNGRIHLLEPLDYADFLALMKAAWLIVSDSGGVQEEAPTMGKPLFILRENTERPEAVNSGIAKLIGSDAERLNELLEKNYDDEAWISSVKAVPNPFGDGRASSRIVKAIETFLHADARAKAASA